VVPGAAFVVGGRQSTWWPRSTWFPRYFFYCFCVGQRTPWVTLTGSIVVVFLCFLADRTNGRAIATLFRLSVCPSVRLSVCDVMYCG